MPNLWLPYARKTFRLENILTPRIYRILLQSAADFAADYKKRGQSAVTDLQTTPTASLQPLLATIHRRAGLTGALYTWAELQPFIKASKKAIGFGRNDRWIAEVIRQLQLSGLQFVQDIDATTRDYILSVLSEGTDKQWTLEEIVAKLTDAGYWQARSRRIARTEINRAANAGHQAAAKDAPFEVNKKWVSARDHRTRHSHQLMNGQVVGENDYFKVPVFKGDVRIGDEEMNAPGDPKASAANTVFCRCRITHQPKTDANGAYIMRETNQARVVPMRSTTVSDNTWRRAIAASLKMHP